MMIKNLLLEGENILKKKGLSSFSLDSELLLGKAISKDREYIILNQRKILMKNEYLKFRDLILKRSKNTPIAYLTNKKSFWKDDFYVEKNVLIPRPETEILVEQILKITNKKKKLEILEVGIGSGCVLISILKERLNFYGTGIDVSLNAVNTCKINANVLKIKNRLKLIKSDIDNFAYGKYDIIVSNPPYIKRSDLKRLDVDIKDYEPKQALDGGIDGLASFRKIIFKAKKLLIRNGMLVLEIGFNQKNLVNNLLLNNGFLINKIIKDHANIDRCIIAAKK